MYIIGVSLPTMSSTDVCSVKSIHPLCVLLCVQYNVSVVFGSPIYTSPVLKGFPYNNNNNKSKRRFPFVAWL